MRKNFPITENEARFSAEQRIVSTTDQKGRITYVNDDFVDVSGFERDEIIGESHNIVRHPHMPSAAFKDLWSTIKSGKPWMGMVKNRCKNGDYYWVDAFVSPVMNGGTLEGYQSVRLKPRAEDVESAEKLYGSLQGADDKKLKKAFRPGLSLAQQFLAAEAAIISLGLLVLLLSPSNLWVISTVFIGMFVLNFLAIQRIATPWSKAAEEARKIIDNPIAQQVYTGRRDELGQLQLAIRFQEAKLQTVVWRISDSVTQLKESTGAAIDSVKSTNENMNNQFREVEMVATAINEMTCTVNEIAQNTNTSADSSRDADHQVSQGKTVVEETINSIGGLANEISSAMVNINELAQKSNDIGGIIEVISEIAEQTNLLALNAAIEAARAGEQGRGFAVVADEVRTLAKKTQDSTSQIKELITNLQTSADKVVAVINNGQETASQCVTQASSAGESLENITAVMNTISQMTMQIATASEEQSYVSEEINKNIIRIRELSEQTVKDTGMITELTADVGGQTNKLDNVVKQFS